MKSLLFNPLFVTGLILRVALIMLVTAPAVAEWYVPFMDITTQQLTLNPWRTWLEAGGSPIAFPYGYVMWLFLLPLVLLCKLLSVPLGKL